MLQSPDSLYHSLLHLTNTLVREVTPQGLFKSLAGALQSMVGCDRVSVTIYEPETDSLAWFAQAEGVGVSRMDSASAPLRGPLARNAIASCKPFIATRLEEFARDEAIRHMIDAGLRSAIAFPLISRGKPIGAVVISFLRCLEQGEEADALSVLLEKIASQVALAVDNMLTHAQLNKQNEYLNEQVDALLSSEDVLHAESRFFYLCSTMENLMNQTRLLARSDAPVLICGETGTGKEFIARFIHRFSPRATANFVKVNCPALSPTLFESELFGHVKGAFTGASTRRIGRFELADKGSIFLDEIGDLDIALQAKLLHVLQDAKFERVGESRSISIDTRCISATNADLYRRIQQGRFRRDLFYRMGVTTIQIPPLRDRQGELIPMLHYLMRMYAADTQQAVPTFHPATLNLLESYHWPGNVRELSNLLARLIILHPGMEIEPDHVLPLLEQSGAGQTEAQDGQEAPAAGPAACAAASAGILTESRQAIRSLAHMEKTHIEQVLRFTNGRVSGKQGAARLLNVPRSTLQYKMRKHGIRPQDFQRLL